MTDTDDTEPIRLLARLVAELKILTIDGMTVWPSWIDDEALIKDIDAALATPPDEYDRAYKLDREAMQRIMQVLGPEGVPDGVDYGLASNLAGLKYEVDETLRILRARGIEYKSRSVERRERLQKGEQPWRNPATGGEIKGRR
jgi:hypothetical protein